MKAPATTATISVALSAAEKQLVMDAAGMASLTVSAWGTTRTAAALSSSASRARALVAVKHIEANPRPRGERSERVSMVMRLGDHEKLKAVAAGQRVAVHALAQAILIDAAEDELEGVPDERLAIVRRAQDERANRPKARTGYVQADIVEGRGADMLVVGDTVRQLLEVMRAQILAGKGTTIAEGVTRTAARIRTMRTTRVPIAVDEPQVEAIAYVLGVSVGDLVTAFAFKATPKA